MPDFAEAEARLPDGGPHSGRYRLTHQPWVGLWFGGIESGRWWRFALTAPSQTGKSLNGFVIIILYCLFELQESVIVGVPDMDMAEDKWYRDLLPAILMTQYRRYLPQRGTGTRGGIGRSIRFTNGAELRFMTAGGKDKSRAGKTGRILVVTEVDGFDNHGEHSDEADKLSQLEARLRAHSTRTTRTYLECTVSTERGRIWQEVFHGTGSLIYCPCPHCDAWILPGREHLIGWREAETVIQARNQATYCCPACAQPINERERYQSNVQGRLVHRGHDACMDEVIEHMTAGHAMTDAEVQANVAPETDTFGLRVGPYNNMFLSASDLAADEWKASRPGVDEDNAARKAHQFWWSIPYRGSNEDHLGVDADLICKRLGRTGRGVLPPGTAWLTVGVDPGKRVGHYMVYAGRADRSGQVIDYGRFDVPSDDLGVELGMLMALRDLRDLVAVKWQRQPDEVWVDSGWQGEDVGDRVIYDFVRESDGKAGPTVFRATKGIGFGRGRSRYYHAPKSKGSVIRQIGDGWHVSRLRTDRIDLVEIDADHWKTLLFDRLRADPAADGAITVTLFAARPQEHVGYAKHLTAETCETVFDAERGEFKHWTRTSKANHWLDATILALVAAEYCRSQRDRRTRQGGDGVQWLASNKPRSRR